jgi:thiosulfate/3-mercaptopyruvate sulfurtransferase
VKLLRNKLMLGLMLTTAIMATFVSACASTTTTTVNNTVTNTATTTVSNNSTATVTNAVTTTVTSTATPTPGVNPTNAATATATPTNYPNSGLLVNDSTLNGELGSAGLIIIDARPAASYAAGHIANAISLSSALFDQADPFNPADATMLQPPVNDATILGNAGVSNTANIIIYDDGGGSAYQACRVFWILDYLGATNIHVLNGGLTKWKADNYATVTTATQAQPAKIFAYLANGSLDASEAYVSSQLNNSNVVLVDSRNATDYVVARIPGAINILMANYLNSDGTVLSFASLTTFLASEGITPGKTIITYCYVGYRSSQAYFIYRLMGYNVTNYDGSMTQWTFDKMPTVSG